jgi:hypothetical protein
VQGLGVLIAGEHGLVLGNRTLFVMRHAFGLAADDTHVLSKRERDPIRSVRFVHGLEPPHHGSGMSASAQNLAVSARVSWRVK